MTNTTNTSQPAAASGTFAIGGDLPVARLGFGTMRLPAATFTGPVRDPEDGIAVLRRGRRAGREPHRHRELLPAWQRRRQRVGPPGAGPLSRRPGDRHQGRPAARAGRLPLLPGHPRPAARPGGDNLRELDVDHLDLVYLRVGARKPPGGEPIAERFAALAKLREEGLIRHLGVSNVDAAQLAEARAIAPVAAVQNAFHVHATADAALLAECARTGTAFVPFFPLGGGFDPIDTTRLEKTAARHGATATQIALAALWQPPR